MTDYIVVKGDNLSKIAKRFGVTVEAIVKINKLKDPNIIKIGQKLQIPDKEAVTIASNELVSQTYADAPATGSSNSILI